jgi:hypothetical protein
MNIEEIVEEIVAQVEGTPLRNAPALRALRREYSKRMEAAPARDVMKIASALIAHRRVPRFIGDELIASRPDAMRILSLTQLWVRAFRAGTRLIVLHAISPVPRWCEGHVEDKAIVAWARSKDRWWRRAALVSTVRLNVKARGGRGDARRTLRICTLLIDDRDEMITKALSWDLRALARRDPDAVRHFVDENEARLPALVRREVRHKLATGRKNPKSSERSKFQRSYF